MKKLLFSLITALVIPLAAHAQQSMVLTSLAANTSSNVIAQACIVDNFTVVNTTTNTCTVKFFDSATTSTNYSQAAYTSFIQYATNYNVVFTNEAGVLVTNTFAGIYTQPVSNSADTNAVRPTILTLIIPASSTLNKDVKVQVIKGLTAVPSQSCTLVTTYRINY